MGLFSRYNEIEQELLNYYSQMFAAMSMPNAQGQAKDILDKAIKESREEETYNLPLNSGDMLLEKEETDEKTRQFLETIRKEGAKNKDIKWWWNLNDVERRMMLGVDELHRLTLFIEKTKEGKTSEQAAAEVRKRHPFYGNPDDTTHTKEDDRSLPVELKDRINIDVEEKFENNPEKFKRDIEKSSTFNALIRKEIRAGKI